jgi:Fe-S-cluster containining protein
MCCERTEMLLSKEDIERVERVGFSREDFAIIGEDGLTRLRNVREWCYFYSPAEKKCQVYEDRPLGCQLYPVIYSIDEGVIVDGLCPVRHTISEHELKMKGKILLKHLKKIASEVTSFRAYISSSSV